MNGVPNPGSLAARSQGCTCPKDQGISLAMKDEAGKPLFWIAEDCPLHDNKQERDRG